MEIFFAAAAASLPMRRPIVAAIPGNESRSAIAASKSAAMPATHKLSIPSGTNAASGTPPVPGHASTVPFALAIASGGTKNGFSD